jgi:hypothetical protein
MSDISDALTLIESLLNDSRITPTGNGNLESKPYTAVPTSGQKWWAAVILGFVYALMSSPAAQEIVLTVTHSTEVTARSIVLNTALYIIVMRIILW